MRHYYHCFLGVLLCQLWYSESFSPIVFSPAGHALSRQGVSRAYALTDRQQQFWEDVDKGLEDIGRYFEKRNQSIDRIRGFCDR